MSTEAKGICQHCEGHIAFPNELAGQTVECPHCKCDTVLVIPPPENAHTEELLEIYLNVKNEQRGPYDKTQVLSMWNHGVITSDSLCWHQGMSDWESISGLISKLMTSVMPRESPAHSTVQVPKSMDTEVAKLFVLANEAAVSGNQQEAYMYYTRILESDPTSSDAWFGKGLAMGWMSTIKEIKAQEITFALINAVKCATHNERKATEKRCSGALLQIAKACYSLNIKHLNKFLHVGNAWPHYIGNANLFIVLLAYAHSCDPENKEIIKCIINILEDTTRSVSYSPDTFGLLKKTFKMPADYVASTKFTIN